MYIRQNLRELFPAEIVLIIKTQIPLRDLRTHVCFLKTCKLTYSLYATEPESFWEQVCFQSGIGCFSDEDPTAVSWKRIAISCILEDGFCNHPACGGNMLEDYANKRTTFRKWIKNFRVLHGEDHAVGDIMECNPLFKYITYQPRKTKRFDENVTLRFGDNVSQSQSTSNHLHKHPIAARSFATFPPVSKMHFLVFPHEVYSLNERGCTVRDVAKAIHGKLDVHLYASEAADLLSWVDYESAFRESDLQMTMYSLTTFRGLLTHFRFDGISLEEWFNEYGPHFIPKFAVIEHASNETDGNKG